MTALRALKYPSSGPDPDVVEALEGWLKRAKAGTLRSVTIAGVTATGEAAQEIATGDGNVLVLLAAVDMQHSRLLQLLREVAQVQDPP